MSCTTAGVYQGRLYRHAPVHALAHAAGGRRRFAAQGHVPGGDAVPPPELPTDAPVPDILKPPASALNCNLLINGAQAYCSSWLHPMATTCLWQ